MALDIPTFKLEVAFGAGPKQSPPPESEWSDLTQYVVGDWSVDRGRNSLLSRTEAGTFTFRLKSENGMFDPTNTRSPYYPNIIGRRQVRLSANGKRIFTGFIESWPLFTDGRYGSEVEVTCYDAFGYLSRVKLVGDQYEYTTSLMSPLVYFKMDDQIGATEIKDYSDNDRNIPVSAGHPVASLVPGRSNQAQNFDGTFRYSTSKEILPRSPNEGTISFWMDSATPALVVNEPVTVLYERLIDGTEYHVLIDFEGHMIVRIKTSGDTLVGLSGQSRTIDPVTDGVAHHIAITFEYGTGNPTIYVDGAAASTPVSAGITIYDVGIGISMGGALTTGLGWPDFEGVLDEFIVLDTQLTDNEVEAFFIASNNWTGQATSERINTILDVIQWPLELREIGADPVPLKGATWEDGSTVLEYLEKITATSNGDLTVTADGSIRYASINTASALESRYPKAIYGDDSDHVPAVYLGDNELFEAVNLALPTTGDLEITVSLWGEWGGRDSFLAITDDSRLGFTIVSNDDGEAFCSITVRDDGDEFTSDFVALTRNGSFSKLWFRGSFDSATQVCTAGISTNGTAFSGGTPTTTPIASEDDDERASLYIDTLTITDGDAAIYCDAEFYASMIKSDPRQISDDFDGILATLDPEIWDHTIYGAFRDPESGTAYLYNESTAVWPMAQIRSDHKTALYSREAVVEVIGISTNADSYSGFKLVADEDGDECLVIEVNDGKIGFGRIAGGTPDISQFTYDGSDHRWWKIAESNGFVDFSTSPDGLNWTLQRSILTTDQVTAVAPWFYAYNETASDALEDTTIDNFTISDAYWYGAIDFGDPIYDQEAVPVFEFVDDAGIFWRSSPFNSPFEVHYSSANVKFDESNLRNRVRLNYGEDLFVEASDPDSIDLYGDLYLVADVEILNVGDVESAARLLVDQYSAPTTFVDRMSLVATNDLVLSEAITRRLGDVLLVRNRNFYGNTVTVLCEIVKISHNWDADRATWRTTFLLNANRFGYGSFVLDSDVSGLLDSIYTLS